MLPYTASVGDDFVERSVDIHGPLETGSAAH